LIWFSLAIDEKNAEKEKEPITTTPIIVTVIVVDKFHIFRFTKLT
tara:strand:+ start:831 stop:965 length:135 start_codon:yes stop_codon:yes gene_type:complete